MKLAMVASRRSTERPIWNGMLEQGFGRVINISSVNGQRGQFGQTNYSAAKAGMHGFTMALAQEGAAKGITVNTVSPGYVETPMTAAMREDVREAIVAGIPMRRMARPDEIESLDVVETERGLDVQIWVSARAEARRAGRTVLAVTHHPSHVGGPDGGPDTGTDIGPTIHPGAAAGLTLEPA